MHEHDDSSNPPRNQIETVYTNTWRMSADTLRETLSIYDERAQELLYWAFQYAKANDITRDDLGKELGVSGSHLSKVLRGVNKDPKDETKMLPPSERLLDAIELKRELEKQRQHLGKTEFVRTPSAKRLWEVCEMARVSNTIAMIYGKSHTGKTWALKAYCAQRGTDNTIYVRIKAGCTKAKLIIALGMALGFRRGAKSGDLEDRIIKTLRSDMVLIFDELHQLNLTTHVASKYKCIEFIRELHDEVGCSIILCGTHIWRDEFNVGRDKSMLEQIERRGIIQLEFGDEPTKADLKEIFKAFALEYPTGEDAARVRKVSKDDGLKKVTELLRLGTKLAVKRKQPFQWQHFFRAEEILENYSKAPKWDSK